MDEKKLNDLRKSLNQLHDKQSKLREKVTSTWMMSEMCKLKVRMYFKHLSKIENELQILKKRREQV